MQRAVELIEELKSLRLKHLPGEHDQKSHGRGGKSYAGTVNIPGLEFGGRETFNSWYKRTLPDGFGDYIRVNATREVHGKDYPEPANGGEGEYSITSEALGGWATLWVTDTGVSTKPMEFHAKNEQEALEKAMATLERNSSSIESQFDKRYRAAMERDSSPLSGAMWAYQENATSSTIGDLISTIKGDRISYREAKESLNKLPANSDGTVTLYRGGKEEGISWSTSKHEAERFAKYGFGGVPVQASGLVGIYAVMGGAEKNPVTVHERKFTKNELLLNIGGSEGEVIADPKAVGVKLKD